MIFENSYCQNSLDYYGVNSLQSNFRLSGLESNSSNYANTSDWEFSLSYSSAIHKNNFIGNLNSASISKRFLEHYFYARFTPGLKQDFIFNTGSSIITNENTEVLESKISYSENFGFGYSYKFNSNISAGFSIRHYEQNIEEEKVGLIFSDTLNNIFKDVQKYDFNFWKFDLGFSFKANDHFLFSVNSNNLLLANEATVNSDVEKFKLRMNKELSISTQYNPIENINLKIIYESSNSGLIGFHSTFPAFSGSFGFGISAFHDKYQKPFITGLMPVISYSNNLYSLIISGITYLENRDKVSGTTNDFIVNGIHNVFNNKYSSNRIFVNLNLALSFKPQQKIKFLELNILDDIYPTLKDKYLTTPIAIGRVANISNKVLFVKPSLLIKELNDEDIDSPIVRINPRDTTEVPFYLIISENKKFDNRSISQAEFNVSIDNSMSEEFIKKPVLINNANSWDGNVNNLKYFVDNDFNFTSAWSKNKLKKYKNVLDTIDSRLSTFVQIESLFNEFVEGLNYVSDPRATSEHVQFPMETIELNGGDCDDLSVSFSAIMESIGIETTIVDYRETDKISHVNLLINTKLKPGESSLITNNEKKYFIRSNKNRVDEVWVPIEMTELKDFQTAWQKGSKKFYTEAVENLGLVKQKVFLFDIR